MDDNDRRRINEASDAITAAANALSDEVARYAGPDGAHTPEPLGREAIARIDELESHIVAALGQYKMVVAEAMHG